MISEGPFTFVAPGTVVTLQDPYAASGVSAVATQIINMTSFIMSCGGATTQVIIPPFTTATIPLTSPGSSLVLTSATNPALYSPSYDLFVTWLLPGEHSPSPNGQLPPPAVNIGLSSAFGPDSITSPISISLTAYNQLSLDVPFSHLGNNGMGVLYGLSFNLMDAASNIQVLLPILNYPVAIFSVPASTPAVFYLPFPMKVQLGNNVGQNLGIGAVTLQAETSVDGYVSFIVYGGNI